MEKPQPPPALSTLQQLENAASKVREEAAMLEQERKAVEAKTIAAQQVAKEHSALASAEARLADAEKKLQKMQKRLAASSPQACQEFGADGADGDKSSSSSSESDEEGPLNRGEEASFFLTCCKLAGNNMKSIFQIPAKKVPTLRPRSTGGGASKDSSPAGSSKGKSSSRHFPKGQGSGTGGGGGAGGQPPRKPDSGKKTPDDAVIFKLAASLQQIKKK